MPFLPTAGVPKGFRAWPHLSPRRSAPAAPRAHPQAPPPVGGSVCGQLLRTALRAVVRGVSRAAEPQGAAARGATGARPRPQRAWRSGARAPRWRRVVCGGCESGVGRVDGSAGFSGAVLWARAACTAKLTLPTGGSMLLESKSIFISRSVISTNYRWSSIFQSERLVRIGHAYTLSMYSGGRLGVLPGTAVARKFCADYRLEMTSSAAGS